MGGSANRTEASPEEQAARLLSASSSCRSAQEPRQPLAAWVDRDGCLSPLSWVRHPGCISAPNRLAVLPARYALRSAPVNHHSLTLKVRPVVISNSLEVLRQRLPNRGASRREGRRRHLSRAWGIEQLEFRTLLSASSLSHELMFNSTSFSSPNWSKTDHGSWHRHGGSNGDAFGICGA
jgi:hypothetical protein